MSAGDVLAQPVVELSVDAEKLNQSVKEALSGIEKLGKATETSFKTIATREIKQSTVATMNYNAQLRIAIQKNRDFVLSQLSIRKNLERIGSATNFGMSAGGLAAGAATGLTFAAAAAAGSTTLDTLTGSLRMLSLAAGAKTQTGVLRISKAIQDLSKTVETAPEGVVGGLLGAGSGALLGAKIGSLIAPGIGTAIGGALGAIGGGVAGSRIESLGSTERIARNLKANPEMITELLKKERELREEAQHSPIAGGEMIGQANRIREAIKMVENKRVPGPEAGPVPAGLGFGSRVTALGNIREEAQLAGFAMGPLELKNLITELQNNTKAIQQSTQGQQADQKPKQGVQSPSWTAF